MKKGFKVLKGWLMALMKDAHADIEGVLVFVQNTLSVLPAILQRVEAPHVRKRIFLDVLLLAAGYLAAQVLFLNTPLNMLLVPFAVSAGFAVLCELFSAQRTIMAVALFLDGIGTVTQLSAGMAEHGLIVRQLVFLVGTLGGLILYYLIPHLSSAGVVWGFTALSAASYALLVMSPAYKGAHLSVHGIMLGELVSRLLALSAVARALTNPEKTELERIGGALIVMGVHGIGLLLCNDISPAAIIVVTAVLLVLLTQKDIRMLLACGCSAAGAALLGWAALPYLAKINKTAAKVWARVNVIVYPGTLDKDAGYQAKQAAKALYRSGMLEASPYSVRVPRALDDYAVITAAQNLGLWALLALVFCAAVLVVAALYRTRHIIGFGTVLACGGAFMLAGQMMLNTAMASGVFPTMGITFPFVSVGNTSIFTSTVLLSWAAAGSSGVEPFSQSKVGLDGMVYTAEEHF